MHQDEDIDLVIQARHAGHGVQKLFRGSQLLVGALIGLKSPQFIFLGCYLQEHPFVRLAAFYNIPGLLYPWCMKQYARLASMPAASNSVLAAHFQLTLTALLE